MITLAGVSRVYRTLGGEVHAVSDADLLIADGEFVAVEGPSGSGKTTLLQLIGALDTPTSGTVSFDGRDLGAMNDSERTSLRRHDIGFVFQQFNLIPTLTALENVEAAQVSKSRAVEVLEQVGLSHRVGHLPSRLSGGEQQRVAIARALANEPRVLLADEPTGNLDTATADDVMRLLASLEGVTVIVITHDENVSRRAKRRIRLRDGRVLDGAPSRDVGECVSCGTRFARASAGGRAWKPCPRCGGRRRTIGHQVRAPALSSTR